MFREDPLIAQIREAIRERAKLPPEVRHRQMVERGVIDEKGNVLLRMPEPPPRKRKRKGEDETGNSHDGNVIAPQEPVVPEVLLLQRMREAICKWAKLPPEMRHREMVKAGVIDEKGNVLLRIPEPPPVETKPKAKRRPRKSQDD